MSNKEEERDDNTNGLDCEEVGVEQCEEKVSTCEAPVHVMEQPPHETGVPFLEEIGEAYVPETIALGIAQDGLPAPMDNGQLAIAPPFTYENVVCIKDDREWVELFFGETSDRPGMNFVPGRSRYQDDGSDQERLVFPKERVVSMFGETVVPLDQFTMPLFTSSQFFEPKKNIQYFLRVRPKRPECVHYQRQLFLNDDQPDPNAPGHKIIFRNCAARRSIGGAAMSLRDEAVLACTWREPRDFQSERDHLDRFDEDRLARQPHKIRLPLFGG